MKNKSGQVTIFIIIAIIIIAIAGLYFTFGKNIIGNNMPESIAPVYNDFINCMQQVALDGISLLESHGGYIYLPEFEPGSSYMPFSSQLDFSGSAIPYWYYVSGNNIPKEQVPTKQDMENQLEKYLQNNIHKCNLDNYYSQGFLITYNNPKPQIKINSKSIDVALSMPFSVDLGQESYFVDSHKFEINTNLGKLYDNAVDLYQQEQSNIILEKYGVDILRLYAPVEGIEFTCSPKIWGADKVFEELGFAIQDNTLALTTENGIRSLEDDTNYFVTDFDLSSDVYAKFINFKTWPHVYEVEPTSGNFLVSNPVGNQPGLGILGFCYNHYHFVYDIKYPVLIQLYKDDELFQFPFAVIIQGNVPRESINGSSSLIPDLNICENKNIPISVNVYDDSFNLINASVSYKCSTETCFIGNSPLQKEFPACVNGQILLSVDGFKDESYVFSTVDSGQVSLFMDREYDLNVELNLGNNPYLEEVVVYINSEDDSKTLFYPQQKRISLSKGEYSFVAYYYSNSSITIGQTVTEQCIDVARRGMLGSIGLTQEKCFEIEFPEQIVSNVLVGGGNLEIEFSENSLKNSNTLIINSEPLLVPSNVQELQANYILFDEQEIGVELK